MPGSHLNDFAVSVRIAKKQRLDKKKKLLWSHGLRLHRTSASGYSVPRNMFKRRNETDCYPGTWKLSCFRNLTDVFGVLKPLIIFCRKNNFRGKYFFLNQNNYNFLFQITKNEMIYFKRTENKIICFLRAILLQ